MKKQIILLFFFYSLSIVSQVLASGKKVSGWKAGVASVIITPGESMWMGGFAFRNRPSEGKLLDVWAKALALQDQNGKRAVLVSVEVSGINKSMSDKIRNRLKVKFDLSKDQVLLSSTHTHSGPAIRSGFTKDSTELIKIERYALKFEEQLVDLVGKALADLQPVTLFSENGVARFQVNRRNNIEHKLHLQSEFRGPNDFSVPVIKVVKESGDLLAIAFGYACHSSVLKDYKISGDYPGFAQVELEQLYPGTTALFFQGAGGNQIAYPRLTDESAKQHGRTLAAAVERVISEDMKELDPNLITTYSEVLLSAAKVPPTKEELLKIISDTNSPDNVKLRAKNNLDKLVRGESISSSYPYPVQVWKIGDQAIITLGGEPVVEYALEIKRIFGLRTFVFGYSNDVMAYITTPSVLNEGGYEGKSSPFSGSFGSLWSPDIGMRIFQELIRLSKQAKVPIADPMNAWVDMGVQY